VRSGLIVDGTGDDGLFSDFETATRPPVGRLHRQTPRLPTGKLYKKTLRDSYWGESRSRIV
jgi:hypothetical protein